MQVDDISPVLCFQLWVYVCMETHILHTYKFPMLAIAAVVSTLTLFYVLLSFLNVN